jgi:cytochrome c oxidase cbb3-type subunit 3
MPRGLWIALLAIAPALDWSGGAVADAHDPPVFAVNADRGESVYRFYCYQCHAYAGDGRTVAAAYLDPPPRDFTAADTEALTRARMLDAVKQGRPGTAMVSFASVLEPGDIEAVVDYVRRSFMGAQPQDARYHTPANGWQDHDRFAAAYPFITGELSLDTPGEELSGEQRAGKRLFLGACATCHDPPAAAHAGPVWEARAVSFPRRHYSHRTPPPALDGVAGATPYRRHERPPPLDRLSDSARRGAGLYQRNCAFCHAPDGTGRHWIGSFLEPHPRDLTSRAIRQRPDAALAAVIRDGLPDSSMPAWRHVLSDADIADVIAYIKTAFSESTDAPVAVSDTVDRAPPGWRPVQPGRSAAGP